MTMTMAVVLMILLLMIIMVLLLLLLLRPLLMAMVIGLVVVFKAPARSWGDCCFSLRERRARLLLNDIR